MAEVIWTASALNDLDEIATYIEIENFKAAKNLVENVFQKTDRLENFPKSGRKVPELKGLDYREIIVNPCRIIYKTSNHTVYSVSVVRQEKELHIYLFSDS